MCWDNIIGANTKPFLGVECEELALGSQEGNGIGFPSDRGLSGTLHFLWPRGLGENKLGQSAIPSALPPVLRISGTRGHFRQLAGKAQPAHEQGQELLLKGQLPVVLRFALEVLNARCSAVLVRFVSLASPDNHPVANATR